MDVQRKVAGQFVSVITQKSRKALRWCKKLAGEVKPKRRLRIGGKREVALPALSVDNMAAMSMTSYNRLSGSSLPWDKIFKC